MARDEPPESDKARADAPPAQHLLAALDAAAGRTDAAVRAQLADARLGWLPAALRRDAQAELQRGRQATARLHAALAPGGAESLRIRRLTTASNGCARAIAALERRAAQLTALAASDLPVVAEAIAAAVLRLRAGALEPAARIERELIALERELTRSRRKVDDLAVRGALDRRLAATTQLVPHVGRLGRWLAGTAQVGVEAIVDEAFGTHGVTSARTVQHALRELAAMQAALEAAGAALAEPASAALTAPASHQHALHLALEELLAHTAPLARQAPGLQEALAAAQRDVAAARPRNGGTASVEDARALVASSVRAAARQRYRVSLGSKSSSTFAPFGS